MGFPILDLHEATKLSKPPAPKLPRPHDQLGPKTHAPYRRASIHALFRQKKQLGARPLGSAGPLAPQTVGHILGAELRAAGHLELPSACQDAGASWFLLFSRYSES